MKKILTGILTAVIIIVIAAVAAYFMLTQTGKPETELPGASVVGADGAKYTAVVDENGVTFAVVQDAEGHLWQVEANADGSLGQTVASLDGVVNASDVLTTMDPNSIIRHSADASLFTGQAEVIEESISQTQQEATQQDEQTSVQETMTQINNNGIITEPTEAEKTTTKVQSSTTSQVSTTQSTTAANVSELNFKKYQDMYSSGSYYVEFSTNDEDLGSLPITSAKKNGNILVTTKLEGITGTVIYQAATDKTFVVLSDWKLYASAPKSLFEEEDMSIEDLDLLSGFFSPKIKVENFKTDRVQLNGETLDRETYTTKSGFKREYYFKDGELVRIDTTDTDGAVSEYYVNEITNDVDDSLFEVPKNYRYINLSWL